MFDLSRYIDPLIIAICTIAGWLAFGNAQIFDQVFFIVLFIVFLLCRKDINTVSIIALIVASRLLYEIGFSVINEAGNLFKSLIYLSSLLIAWKLRDDPFAKVAILSVAVSITAQFYWFHSNYKAPEIEWSVFVISLCLIFRYAITMRIYFINKFMPGKAKDLIADTAMLFIAAYSIVIELILLAEYILRHLSVTSSLTIYNLYPYATQVSTVIVVWALIYQTRLIVKERSLSA